MACKVCKFSDCNLNDCFFDSLREDYAGLDDRFRKKSAGGEQAYVYSDEGGIQVFLYIKPEE